jgi:hypothetical protein
MDKESLVTIYIEEQMEMFNWKRKTVQLILEFIQWTR